MRGLDPRNLILRLGDEVSTLPFDKLHLRQRAHCGRGRVGFAPHYMLWSAMC